MSRIVVVGGGIGGIATCAALRSGGYAGEVVLLDRAAFPYDRPPLSKEYLAGTRDLAQIALQPPQWYADQRIELIGNAEAASLTLPGRSGGPVIVTLADGRTWSADQVVLATGGRAARPPIPGSDSARVHVLRDYEDADALRSALAPGKRLLIVGGGLIGAEAASTAHGLGASVVLLDPLDPPLVAAVGAATAAWLHGLHREAGVETLATVLESLHETPTGIAASLRGEESPREFDAVLLGVGMTPATALAAEAGLEVDRGVLVDDHQQTSHPQVYAVGDCARRRDHPRTEHWEAAQHDGRRAAAAILGAPAPAATAPWWWSDRYHHHVEGVGRMHEAGPDPVAGTDYTVVVRGQVSVPPYAVFILTGDRVVGAVAVDDSQAVRAARRLIDRGIAVDPVHLADPATDLRTLVRG